MDITKVAELGHAQHSTGVHHQANACGEVRAGEIDGAALHLEHTEGRGDHTAATEHNAVEAFGEIEHQAFSRTVEARGVDCEAAAVGSAGRGVTDADHELINTLAHVARESDRRGIGHVEAEHISIGAAVEHHAQGCAAIAVDHLGADGQHRCCGGDVLTAEGGRAVGGDVDSDRAAGVASEAHTPIAFSHRKFGDVGDVDREALAVGQATIGRLNRNGIGRLAFKVGAGTCEEQLGATDLEAGGIGALEG